MSWVNNVLRQLLLYGYGLTSDSGVREVTASRTPVNPAMFVTLVHEGRVTTAWSRAHNPLQGAPLGAIVGPIRYPDLYSMPHCVNMPPFRGVCCG